MTGGPGKPKTRSLTSHVDDEVLPLATRDVIEKAYHYAMINVRYQDSVQVEMTRLIVGLSGASGIIYGIRLLEVARELGIGTDLIMTGTAEEMIAIETSYQPEEVRKMATRVHGSGDMTSPLASGGYRHDGMVVIPCSMKTIAGVACGFADNLLMRAADCALKEKRPLILVPRETPINQIHLRNMLSLANAGAVILPASPGFYHRPETINGLVDHIVGKTLDSLRIDHHLYRRWEGYRPS